MTSPSPRLSPNVRTLLAREIAAAGGREVCFVGSLDEAGVVTEARAVARGTADEVLALPGVADRGEMVLHNHPSGWLEPSPADLSIAARLHDGGIVFGIVNNAGTELFVVVEVPRRKSVTRLDPFAVLDTLGPGGPIAARMGGFEDRQGQRDMAAYVADAYNDGGGVLLEGGTGVGKSSASLVPACGWENASGDPPVAPTNTITPGERLVGKALPLLREALGTDAHVP